jgi:hypothetical protein
MYMYPPAAVSVPVAWASVLTLPDVSILYRRTEARRLRGFISPPIPLQTVTVRDTVT